MKTLLNFYRFILLVIAAWKATFGKDKTKPDTGAQTTAEVLDQQQAEAESDNAEARKDAAEKTAAGKGKSLEERQRETEY